MILTPTVRLRYYGADDVKQHNSNIDVIKPWLYFCIMYYAARCEWLVMNSVRNVTVLTACVQVSSLSCRASRATRRSTCGRCRLMFRRRRWDWAQIKFFPTSVRAGVSVSLSTVTWDSVNTLCMVICGTDYEYSRNKTASFHCTSLLSSRCWPKTRWLCLLMLWSITESVTPRCL